MNDFFSAREGGGVSADLSGFGWRIALYLDDLDTLLGPDPELPDDPLSALAMAAETPALPPTDPVLARLLPEGILDAGEGADEFRQFSQATLLARKRRDARALRQLLEAERSDLDANAAREVLGALNDLRLMLGTKLMVSEGDPELDDANELAAYRVYQLLGLLQEELLQALT
jgi:hypothetical protein